jgi:formylglycine-generating enzyme required for sulfatase activity
MLVLAAVACALGCAVWMGLATAGEPAANLPKTKVNPTDGAEMVQIPAGEFLMGTSEEELKALLPVTEEERAAGRTWATPGHRYDPLPDRKTFFADELPQHKVYLDAYYMYKTEVTRAQYRKFCEATKRAMPPNPEWIPTDPESQAKRDAEAIVNVSWDDANAYAKWAGGALPTEAQWEKAARGGDRRLYPWGDAWPPPKGAGNFPDQTLKGSGWAGLFWCLTIDGYTDGYAYVAPVGKSTANPYGLYDLAGNVEEWCADWYDADYYKKSPEKNPSGPATGTDHMIRGGSWGWYQPAKAPGQFRCADRNRILTEGWRSLKSAPAIGFRCVVLSPGP